MKALYFDGQSLQLKALPVPEPGDQEALIRVQLAGICNTDLEIIRGYMGFTGVLGHEFVGVVEQAPYPSLVGKMVVGEINLACGECLFCQEGMKTHCSNRTVLGILNKDGAMAEYVTLPVQNLHVVPPAIQPEEAVFTEPLAAACEILEQIRVLPEYRVLVLGDGKLGQLIAQVLWLENHRVLVAGKHPEKLALLKKLGINTTLVDELDGVRQFFHVVVEATGKWEGWHTAMRLVRPRGFLVLKSTHAGQHPYNMAEVVINEVAVVGSRCGPFTQAISLLEHRRVRVEPLITAMYPIEAHQKAFQHARQPDSLKILFQFSE